MPCFYTISLLRLLPSDNVLRSQQPRSQGLDPRSRKGSRPWERGWGHRWFMRTIALTKTWNWNKVYYGRYSVISIENWNYIRQLVPVLYLVLRSVKVVVKYRSCMWSHSRKQACWRLLSVVVKPYSLNAHTNRGRDLITRSDFLVFYMQRI